MLSVDWPTSVITIPQSYLTLISGSLYELDLYQLHLDLRTEEATALGGPYSRTHDHDTEVSLSGLVYARRVNILPPYTVTFEDGQYGVNMVGANSNVFDVVNRNQVSVGSQNSAGLVNPLSAQIVQEAIWSTARSENNAPGTMGEALQDIYRILGLEPGSPLRVTRTKMSAGSVTLQISSDANGKTATRT